VQKEGLILKLNQINYEVSTYLDLTGRTNDLHSLAFHPEYNLTESPFYGTLISMEVRSDVIHVIKYKVSSRDNTMALTLESERILFYFPIINKDRITDLAFAPDGSLWIGTSDIDDSDYIDSQSQYNDSPYGKVFRINLANHEVLPSIIARGFRYPRQITIDSYGNAWVADSGVGIETVKFIASPSITMGVNSNYGWPAINGNKVYIQKVADMLKYEGQEIISPIITYELSDDDTAALAKSTGRASREDKFIIGAIPYRGTRIDKLRGKVLIANSNGQILLASLTPGNGFTVDKIVKIQGTPITSLDQNAEGVLYISAFNPITQHGMVLRIDPSITRTSLRNVETSNSAGKDEDKDWFGGWWFWIIIVIVIVIIVVIFAMAYDRIDSSFKR
jgi:hypothetical protein